MEPGINVPVPGTLPVAADIGCADIEEAALALYQKLADTVRTAEEAARHNRETMDEQVRESRRLIARLAAERFEFERLTRRILPELGRLEAADIIRAVDLYRRAWDQLLRHNGIDVCDLTGCPLTPEVTEDIEVEGHVPDPAVEQTVIRETLFPLVRVNGETIGLARVITSVPATQEEQK